MYAQMFRLSFLNTGIFTIISIIACMPRCLGLIKVWSLFALPFSRANNDQAELNRISALQYGTNVQILCQIYELFSNLITLSQCFWFSFDMFLNFFNQNIVSLTMYIDIFRTSTLFHLLLHKTSWLVIADDSIVFTRSTLLKDNAN